MDSRGWGRDKNSLLRAENKGKIVNRRHPPPLLEDQEDEEESCS